MLDPVSNFQGFVSRRSILLQIRTVRFLFSGILAGLFFLSGRPVYGDEFHNINGFFGSDAPGLGGAWTALSRGPAGFYYNPGGVVQGASGQISVSSDAFVDSTRTYRGTFQPGMDDTRQTRGQQSRFFGVQKRLGMPSYARISDHFSSWINTIVFFTFKLESRVSDLPVYLAHLKEIEAKLEKIQELLDEDYMTEVFPVPELNEYRRKMADLLEVYRGEYQKVRARARSLAGSTGLLEIPAESMPVFAGGLLTRVRTEVRSLQDVVLRISALRSAMQEKNRNPLTVGFSIVYPSGESLDQSDFVYRSPIQSFNSYQREYIQDSSSTLVGPGVSIQLSKWASVGASLYYFTDSDRMFRSDLVLMPGNAYTSYGSVDWNTSILRRSTSGFIPVLGVVIHPLDFFSFGASIRKTTIYRAYGRLSSYTVDGDHLQRMQSLENYRLTSDYDFVSDQEKLMIGSPLQSGRIPETTEARAGVAIDFGSLLRVSGDLIYTSGYRYFEQRYIYDLSNEVFFLYDREDELLHREPTLNHAIGVELFPEGMVSLRLGFFTNKSNARPITWNDSVLDTELERLVNEAVEAGPGGCLLDKNARAGYCKGEASFLRSEYVDYRGYTAGMSVHLGESTTVTGSVIYETGDGLSTAISGQAPQPLSYKNTTVTFMTTARE